jgi:uncharacterized protein (DUF58 family)
LPRFFLAISDESGILESVKIESPRSTVQFRNGWVLGLIAAVLLLQFIVPNRAWIAVLCGMGGAIGLGYLWSRQLAEKVRLTRQQYYGWIHVGDVLEERFELHNDSILTALWVEIDDQSDLPGYTARTVRSAAGQQSIQWRSQGICRQRGLFTLGPCQVRLSDPFGFFRITLTYPETQSILIYPPVVHLPALRLPRGEATGAGRTSRRALDVTTNAASIRQYIPGDSLNRVHWRSTARRDSLMVKTFDLEPSGDLWIVLDLDASVQAGEGEESTEEYGIILASSLANQTLHQNRAVGLVAYGTMEPRDGASPEPRPTIVLPQKGGAQQWRILEALATVHAGGKWPLERVLSEMDRNLGRGTILALITPSCHADWVAGLLPPMRRGVTPTVLLLDPVSFGGEGNVAALMGLLADLGISSHRIERGTPFQPIVEHKRTGPPEFRVLPGFGRVVMVEE